MRPHFFLCALLAGSACAAAEPGQGFDVAITVDDLSAHGSLPAGMRWPDIAASYLETLKAHRVPEAWGFVNAVRLQDAPGSAAVLDLWRRAGYPLGNHTASHLGLSQVPSLAAWKADVKRGEAPLAAAMQGADWHVLRYPYLDAGANPARHDAAAAWLQGEGYRIADVSVSFDDWAYTETYARCLAKGDQGAIETMRRSYLARVDAGILRMKALSRRVYGRMIPQVLLTHMGAWSAATLPAVLERLDAAGARYVTLAQAQRDPAYRDGGPQSGNGILPERRARDRGVSLDDLPQVPPPGNLDGVCR
jgi:hypothetical protein